MKNEELSFKVNDITIFKHDPNFNTFKLISTDMCEVVELSYEEMEYIVSIFENNFRENKAYEEAETNFKDVLKKVETNESLNWVERHIVYENIKEETGNTDLLNKLIKGESLYFHDFDFIFQIMKSKER